MRRNPPGRSRLSAIAELVPPGTRVADIGTGHGKLALWLCAHGIASSCVATERTPELLAEARRRSHGHRGAAGVDFRSGDGLAALRAEDRIEVVILAGMGARKMIRILEDGSLGQLSVRRLVLQPQSESDRLRRWLAAHGFGIYRETVAVERGRAYDVIAAAVEPAPALLS